MSKKSGFSAPYASFNENNITVELNNRNLVDNKNDVPNIPKSLSTLKKDLNARNQFWGKDHVRKI